MAFYWLAQFLAARGYAVIQPNYRGSAGFSDAWLGEKGFKAWRTSIGDVTAAAHWLSSQGIADPDRLAIVGWSYGGYAALQSAVTEPGLYKAVVAIAPITDLGKSARRRLLHQQSNSCGCGGSWSPHRRRLALASCRCDPTPQSCWSTVTWTATCSSITRATWRMPCAKEASPSIISSSRDLITNWEILSARTETLTKHPGIARPNNRTLIVLAVVRRSAIPLRHDGATDVRE